MDEFWEPLVTTAGTLVAAFGGFIFAGRAQRRADEHKDARDREFAAQSRAILLEDERHAFQRETLIDLQALLNQKARNAYLEIEADRKAVAEHGRFFQLPEGLSEAAFTTDLKFSHTVARVTNDTLRKELIHFKDFCAKVSVPPPCHESMSKGDLLDRQKTLLNELANMVNAINEMLGEYLRAELDRTASPLM